MMWSELYRPARVEQMVGNEDARLAVVKWLSGWVSGSKPLLLIGQPGVGKTTLVHALARQLNYDLVEMNASDTRNRNILESRITPILNNTSIFGKDILLFLDEVDGISGREDTGGVDALVRLMKEPTVPVIMAANVKSANIKELSKACKVVNFSPVPPRLLMMLLEWILKSEKKILGPGDKISVVNNSHGDIRSMLNSAQSRAAGYATVSNKDILEVDITDAINRYFSAGSMDQAVKILSKADASYSDPRFEMTAEARRRDILGALYTSIVSSRADAESIAAMLDTLSRADVIVGRMGRKRHWSLLKYLDTIVGSGLYEKSRQKGIKYSQYGMIWPVMGPIFARGQTMRKLNAAIAPLAHTSKSTFGSMSMPYLVRVMLDSKIDPAEFVEASNLDESLVESFAKEMDRAKKKAK